MMEQLPAGNRINQLEYEKGDSERQWKTKEENPEQNKQIIICLKIEVIFSNKFKEILGCFGIFLNPDENWMQVTERVPMQSSVRF